MRELARAHLGVMDVLSRRKDAKPWSASNNPLKTNLIDPAIDKFVSASVQGDKDLPLSPLDTPSTSLNRGKTLRRTVPAIGRYLDRFGIEPPDVLVVGHTHRMGDRTQQVALESMAVTKTMHLVNTGSWVSSHDIPVPESGVCMIAEDGAASLHRADLCGEQ